MDLVSDGVDTEEQSGHKSDEDEQAPAGTETIFADENLMESRRRRRWNWFAGGQRGVVVGEQVVGLNVQGASLNEARTLNTRWSLRVCIA
jgi:hypothetical protein